jgi:hypothetical protein
MTSVNTGNEKKNRFHSDNHEKSSKCVLTEAFWDAIIKNILRNCSNGIEDDGSFETQF